MFSQYKNMIIDNYNQYYCSISVAHDIKESGNWGIGTQLHRLIPKKNTKRFTKMFNGYMRKVISYKYVWVPLRYDHNIIRVKYLPGENTLNSWKFYQERILNSCHVLMIIWQPLLHWRQFIPSVMCKGSWAGWNFINQKFSFKISLLMHTSPNLH